APSTRRPGGSPPDRVAQPWPASRRWPRLRDSCSRRGATLRRRAHSIAPQARAPTPSAWASVRACLLPAPERRVARAAADAVAGDAAGAHVASGRRLPLRLVLGRGQSVPGLVGAVGLGAP